MIDHDHIGLIMADVSGKGVPAALFMMMSKILVNNFAMMGGSPAKVLEQVNSQICKNNDEEMFVTVWFGVLEISTGKVTAANAGHEYPIIKKADGEFELFKDKHGFVIGGMDGMRYKEYEFTLEKGGTLFLYTDGVAEATNAENELFGTDRMLTALNQDPNAVPKVLLTNMKKAVDEFVGEAPQFDDLTMLGVTLL
jgi:sigma-B regulation protein RsbU (phosphoserine phosphatase)